VSVCVRSLPDWPYYLCDAFSRLRSCNARQLLRDEFFACSEMEGSPLRLHTKFKPDSTGQTRFAIFKPNDPHDFMLMDRLTDVFVEPSRLLSFRLSHSTSRSKSRHR
jgi:hypothetical protein